MRKLLSENEENVVVEMLKKGVRCTDVSKTLGVSYNAVYYISTKINCKRLHRYSNAEIEYLKENYGIIPAIKIANYLNVPICSVYNKARNLGLHKFKRK